MYLKNIPPPILVGFVACDVVEVPETLNGLRPEEVARVFGLGVKVVSPGCSARLLIVEMGDFGRQMGGLACKRHVARVGQLLGHLQQHVG